MNNNQTQQFQQQPQAPQGPMKTCKHCKSIIPKGAKVCPVCRKKQGGIGKWIVIAVVAIFIIAAIGSGGNDNSNTAKNEPATSNADANTDADTNANTDTASTKEATGITEEKYDSIQTGMTYEEVIDIIGENGTSISESEIAGIKTVIYEWTSSEGWGNANITFQDGKVVNKAQFGISSGDDIEITLDQYNSIETGMSYEEVVALLGGEGALLSDTEIAGSKSQIYMWNGTSLGANANVTFSDGKVISKSQLGLK